MNTMTTHRNWSWIAAVIAVGLVTSSAMANTVRLKRGAVVEPDRALVLRDIAELDGAYAADLGGTLIAAEAGELLDAAGSGSVSLNRVRASLERDGAILSRLTLSGKTKQFVCPYMVSGRRVAGTMYTGTSSPHLSKSA